MIAYALTILCSAFLLFAVQPVIAKTILPWFGGAPAVWTTCMLFFQALLLAGYAYAHFIIRVLRPAWQSRIHMAVLALSLLQLPLHAQALPPGGAGGSPALQVLAVLAAAVALPYFALSSTAPLVQAWVARRAEAGSPYRLYALSNVGSLCALLGYPFVLEPLLTGGAQRAGWSAGFALFVALCLWVSWRARAQAPGPSGAPTASSPRAPLARMALWGLLPACASVLLLAVTSQMCQEIAVVPLLWLLPLTLYLLSFVLCFDSDRWYRRGPWLAALGILSVPALGAFFAPALDTRLALTLYASYLFVACMVCHGELVRLRPAADHLTGFYLMVSVGGAAGGFLVAVVAPLVFPRYFELPLGIAAALALAAVAARVQSPDTFRRHPWKWFAWVQGTVAIATTTVCVLLLPLGNARLVERNFYGVLRVEDGQTADGSAIRRMVHGATVHGVQFQSPERSREPTAYFGRESGVGRVLADGDSGHPRRIGVLGLGAGTVAAYTRPGDVMKFYEINPLVVAAAQGEFSFMAQAAGRVEIEVDDARLALERETGVFDVLLADVYSGDAAPVHLLTEEAFALYFRLLRPDGVLAVNITNRGMDLRPVVVAAARALGRTAIMIRSPADEARGYYPADWILISADAGYLRTPRFADALPLDGVPGQLWRDDYSNLLGILK